MLRFLPTFFLAGSLLGAVAKIYDVAPPGWILAWENLILSDHLEFSQCLLACEVKKGCVGGRFESATEKCHLQVRSDIRNLAMYKTKTGATDRVFGVICNPKTGFYEHRKRAILDYNTEIHYVSSVEKCTLLCEQRFWCRTLEWNDSRCNLQWIGNETDRVVYHMINLLLTRIC